MRKIFFIVLAIALSACALGAKNDLSANQQKWETSGVKHYRYDLHIGCFCAFRDKMPLSIEVKDGAIVSMSYADGTAVTADDPEWELFSRFATFDNLFTDLQSGPGSKAEEVTMKFDPDYGFPSEVVIDQIKAATDDEYYLTVSNFEVLK
jgi:hypothetical protein